MYNGTAYVNTANQKYPVYQLNSNETDITSKQIGTIYPNECFGIHPSEGNVMFVVFRNSSGGISIGGFGKAIPPYILYSKKKSNGNILLDNYKDSDGYYIHKLSKNMNWYIGTIKQKKPLEKGTLIRIKDCTTGSSYPTRIACSAYKLKDSNNWIAQKFWVDYLKIGSMPNTRAIL